MASVCCCRMRAVARQAPRACRAIALRPTRMAPQLADAARGLTPSASSTWKPPGGAGYSPSSSSTARPPSSGGGCETSSMYKSVEEAQEMMALLHRNISEELLREVERRRQRFDLQQEPSRALGSESSLVISPSQLLERLKRFPMEPPSTADRAEEIVCAMENELKALSSPVIDVSLPTVGSDPRMVVVGDTHGQLQDVLHILEENGPPSEEVAYLFNGDIVDRGRHAVEIWMLIIAYKLAYPRSVYVLRGNHENDQMIARPFKMGGGFTEECLSKYNHRVLAAFQRIPASS